MNLGHPPRMFFILWGFCLRGQEIPPNSADDPAMGPDIAADEPLPVVGQEVISRPAVGQVSRLDRRDCPPPIVLLRLLRQSLYSILYWGLGVLGAADLEGAGEGVLADLEGAGAGVLGGVGEDFLDDAGLAMTS